MTKPRAASPAIAREEWEATRPSNALRSAVRHRAASVSEKLAARGLGVFLWRKKLDRDLSRGIIPAIVSVRSERRRCLACRREADEVRAASVAMRRASSPPPPVPPAASLARAEEEEAKEAAFLPQQGRLKAAIWCRVALPSTETLLAGPEWRKPKYVAWVRTGYEWNKYNRVHYDHDHPPPKVVKGYMFVVHYPDLDLAGAKTPQYTVEEDGSGSDETYVVRFHSGWPYEDVAFRIVNREWECSRKAGFRASQLPLQALLLQEMMAVDLNTVVCNYMSYTIEIENLLIAHLESAYK